MSIDTAASDFEDPATIPILFEWQRLDWLFEPDSEDKSAPPYALYINNSAEGQVKCRQVKGRWRLTGATNLGNHVGHTRFEIRDSKSKCLLFLGVEIFPQKLDYRTDFPAMIEEVTEVIYSLAFDLFKKTYASTKTRTTYHQSLSEWMNLYRVLAESFQQSIDTILRSPKYTLRSTTALKSIDKVKKTTNKALLRAGRNPRRYCRGGGIEIVDGLVVSHLEEQRKRATFDIHENRFVVRAIGDVMEKLAKIVSSLQMLKGGGDARAAEESTLLRGYQRKLRFRLLDSTFSDLGAFDHRNNFSTTMTMAPGYKEFYHRYLLLRKGLSIADNSLFKMDYKDIATLYEYWCFLKTIKLLPDNPKYDLTSSEIVKIEHQKFSVNLKKGQPSAVNFKQRTTGDDISVYYNKEFSANKHTHTFNQVPDNFIEFERSGYGGGKDKKRFKVVLDAKYRFDRGSGDYPEAKNPFGPPLDTIAQLHRYRDAILWQEDSNDSVKVANKSIGGVILFPYSGEEQQFIDHPFYQSIDRVNIGAVPLQPGKHRKNVLYQSYLDSLFESSGAAIHEKSIRYDSREYEAKRDAERDLIFVGWGPRSHRAARLKYHFEKRLYYTRWQSNRESPLEKVKGVALFDASKGEICAYGDVVSIGIQN